MLEFWIWLVALQSLAWLWTNGSVSCSRSPWNFCFLVVKQAYSICPIPEEILKVRVQV